MATHTAACFYSRAFETILTLTAGVAPGSQQTRFVVVDHAERVADTDLFATLLRAREITGILTLF